MAYYFKMIHEKNLLVNINNLWFSVLKEKNYSSCLPTLSLNYYQISIMK